MPAPVFDDRWFLIIGMTLGLLCAWGGRYFMTSDGISYLDLGDAYLRGDWAQAANAYWSPLYPWLLGIAMRIFHPSLWWEFPVAHLVNFVVFVASLFSFRFFIGSLLLNQSPPAKEDDSRLPDWAVRGIGYCLFGWCSLALITVQNVTPDLLLSAWIFLFGGLLVRLRTQVSYPKYAALGLVLGAAYLTKSVMFPLSIVFLGIVLFSTRISKATVFGVALATLVFAVVAAPLVLMLSKAKGRLTFGESGKLSYAWIVSPGASQINWQGGDGEIPLHATRRLVDHPPLFEFAEPVGGTFPPWYDPSYWNDGLHPRFRFRAQVRALLAGWVRYGTLLTSQLGLVAGVLTLVFLGGKGAARLLLKHWPLIVAALAAMGLYSLVLVLPRYVGAFAVLLGMALISGIRLARGPGVGMMTRSIALAVMITTALPLAQSLFEQTFQELAGGRPLQAREPMLATEALAREGLRAGDRVAVIGVGITDFWARLGGLKIVCQVMPQGSGNDEFWNSSQQQKDLVYAMMARTGARAVVTWNSSSADLGPGWQRLPGTFYHARLLNETLK